MRKLYKIQILVPINEVLNSANKKFIKMCFLSCYIRTYVMPTKRTILSSLSGLYRFMKSLGRWQGREPGQEFQRGSHGKRPRQWFLLLELLLSLGTSKHCLCSQVEQSESWRLGHFDHLSFIHTPNKWISLPNTTTIFWREGGGWH